MRNHTCTGRDGVLPGGPCSFKPGPANTSSWVLRFFMGGEGDKYPGMVWLEPLAAICTIKFKPMLWSPWNRARLSSLPSKFLQSTHLQLSEQRMFAWKHSQYFFKHPDFLQWHPLLCLPISGCSPTSSCKTKNQLGLSNPKILLPLPLDNPYILIMAHSSPKERTGWCPGRQV